MVETVDKAAGMWYTYFVLISAEVRETKIINLYPGGFSSSCYLLLNGPDALLIDCSAPTPAVEAALQEHRATLKAILCTHGHFDHILSADQLRTRFGVPLHLHEADAEMLTDCHKNAYALFFNHQKSWLPADHTFADGDKLTFGSITLTVRHTPGHSKGSCVLLTADIAFTGDTIFAAGYGRTDLYGGNEQALLASLRGLSQLPKEMKIYPGHGPSTTLGMALDRLF